MIFSLRNKTILGIAVIEASLLILLVFTAVNFMRDTLNDGLIKRASTVATLFATTTKDSVLSYDLASLEAYCLELMKNPDIAYIRVVNGEGQMLAQAGEEKWLTKPFEQDQSMQSVTDGIFDSFAIISESEHIYGRVELGVDITTIERSIRKVQNWTSGIALVEMLLVALFSFVLGTYLTRQLQGLRKAAKVISRNVASGEFQHPKIAIRGKDELAEVAEAFNKLAKTLETEHDRKEAYQQQLKELNTTLEERVTKRTAQLNLRNTQLEQLNQELTEAQQQLVQAEKMASVGQLAAGVAHEINNPIGFVNSNLSSLKQYTETYLALSHKVTALMASEDADTQAKTKQDLSDFIQQEDLAFVSEDTQDLLDESIEGLERVKGIVQGLKQFSRADADEKQLVDINDCITTTLNMVNNQLKYHCQIVQNLNPIPKAWVNVGKISQVLTNLLINAGQAIDEKGLITITSKHERDHICISIEDNGSGIASEHLTKLFDPFFTTKEEGVGTGLGLSISYGIIQDHGGDIKVDSTLGKGTCFSIVLPAKQADNFVEDNSNE